MSKVLMSQNFQSLSVSSTTYMYIPTPFLPSTKRIVCFIYSLSFSHCYRSRIILLNTSDPNERCHFWVLESTLTSSGAELLDTPVAERMYIERDAYGSNLIFMTTKPGLPKLTEGVQVKRESKRPPYTVCVSSTTTFVVC